jgi:hypothetical protein
METNGTKNLKSKPIAKLLDQLNHDHKFFEKFIEKRNYSGNFNETKYSENNDSFSDISSLNLNDQKNDESFNSSCFDEKSLEENIIIKKKKDKNNTNNINEDKNDNSNFNKENNNFNTNFSNNSNNDSYIEDIIMDLENEFNDL